MDIAETTFPSRTYLVKRQEIPIESITDQSMWEAGFGAVYGLIQQRGLQVTGPGAALYFSWDEKAGKTDFGIGSPVAGEIDVTDGDVSTVSVGESKALTTTIQGDYGKLRDGHAAMTQAVSERDLTPTLTVEEYEVAGMDSSDANDWKTNLYYLYE